MYKPFYTNDSILYEWFASSYFILFFSSHFLKWLLHPILYFIYYFFLILYFIYFLDVLFTIQEDGSLGHKIYRKPTDTDTDRYLHYNSFHHPSIKISVCKTLINRAKTICEVSNIDDELGHLRWLNTVLKKWKIHDLDAYFWTILLVDK
jgi:hypothetical protein